MPEVARCVLVSKSEWHGTSSTKRRLTSSRTIVGLPSTQLATGMNELPMGILQVEPKVPVSAKVAPTVPARPKRRVAWLWEREWIQEKGCTTAGCSSQIESGRNRLVVG